MPFLTFMFSPLGRTIGVALAILIGIGAVYMRGRSDATAGAEAAATSDALRRTENAIRAGNSIDVTPDGLRDNDGKRRD